MSHWIAMFAVVLSVHPSDSLGCGSYEADLVLEDQVAPLLVDGGAYADIRTHLGLTAQSPDSGRWVEDEPTVCEPLVEYFVDNMASLADSTRLNAYGWHHAVMRFGSYWIVLVVPKHPSGGVLPHRSYLIFFDDAANFVAVSQI